MNPTPRQATPTPPLPSPGNPSAKNEAHPPPPERLRTLRDHIQRLDGELVELMARRCRLAQAAGVEKSRAGLPMADPAREAQVVRHTSHLARDQGLDQEAIRQIFWCLIGLARHSQASPAATGGQDRPCGSGANQ